MPVVSFFDLLVKTCFNKKGRSMKPTIHRWLAWPALGLLVLALVGACGSTASPGSGGGTRDAMPELKPVSLGGGEQLRVVATTNIIGDVASRIGGDRIELTTLMRVGVDPHSYVPTPADTAAVHDAHLVLANGLGLEAFLETMIQSAGGSAVEIHLSDGLSARPAPTGAAQDAELGAGGGDPHIWFDVQNVMQWAGTIRDTLSTLDPANAQIYAANAAAYTSELQQLDAWIAAQVATIPEADRKLVTNHPAFGYLAGRYGLEQVGTVYPISPSAEPSARDIAALEDTIRSYGALAIFTESTVNPRLAEQVAQDTGVKLVQLYTGSLGSPGSGAETYIDMMRYDVTEIVQALR
jgi:ABC-type Zn uptake system ZnuABC Zn-binding protein ZnuA